MSVRENYMAQQTTQELTIRDMVDMAARSGGDISESRLRYILRSRGIQPHKTIGQVNLYGTEAFQAVMAVVDLQQSLRAGLKPPA